MNTAKAWRAARRWPVVVVVGAFVLGALVGNGVGHRRSSLSYIDAYAECLLQRVTAGMGNDAVQAVEFGCARRAPSRSGARAHFRQHSGGYDSSGACQARRHCGRPVPRGRAGHRTDTESVTGETDLLPDGVHRGGSDDRRRVQWNRDRLTTLV